MSRWERSAARSGGGRQRARSHAVSAACLAAVAAVLLCTFLTAGGGRGAGAADRTRDTAGTPRGAQAPAGTRRGAQAPAGAQARVRAQSPARVQTGHDEEHCSAAKRPEPGVGRITKAGKLVVGVDQNSYLWGYRKPNSGEIEGFDIDLVHAIAKDLFGTWRDRVVYKAISTDERECAIRQGKVDMVVRTMTIDKRAEKQVAFSVPYFRSGQQLVVPKHTGITGLKDKSMRGERLCLASGSTAEALWKSLSASQKSGIAPKKAANQLDCLMEMQLGRVDATLTDGALGVGQAAQDPTVKVLGRLYTHESYGVAMNLNDKDLVSRVDKVLKAYMAGGADSQWSKSYEDWLGPHVKGRDGAKAPPPPMP